MKCHVTFKPPPEVQPAQIYLPCPGLDMGATCIWDLRVGIFGSGSAGFRACTKARHEWSLVISQNQATLNPKTPTSFNPDSIVLGCFWIPFERLQALSDSTWIPPIPGCRLMRNEF